jgi:hypothetical protein
MREVTTTISTTDEETTTTTTATTFYDVTYPFDISLALLDNIEMKWQGRSAEFR